ncbi:MAG: hypothetical protein ACM34L_15005 [Gemmatimonas sp.]|nr:hypothetical protein [Gemmatimonadaceae bacterium]
MDIDVAFKVPLDIPIPIPDLLESPIFMFDMLVSFMFDIWLFVMSPVRVTV